ncbi:hemolysin family protein [Calidifontibacter indicus]|uniref:CBS domain containing-hemolysin-like protein n=1 Tax=Calidifontibacter indicus TaxID=419650 RepID=A0A3D9UZ12_9MICO|nr:hemolysin family protein [Calidifontibacter indicus]REF31845.1 CBS domain containing-hemolysin-like protein [Calidifontibacter indicus]
MYEWILIGLGVLLTAGTAMFVAAEFSLVALDRPSVQRAADEGDAGARSVLASLRSLSTQLSAAQVGITLTTLVLGWLVEPSLGRLLEGPLTAIGLSEPVAATTSTVVALVIASIFSMIFGELIPQFLGISAPLGVATVVAAPVRFVGLIFKPLILLLNGSANAILRSLNIEPQEELSAARTPQELASMVRHSAAAGTMEEGTARLLARSLGFGERVAADVMTPRVRCSFVERTASAEDVIDLARATGHSRFPVLGDGWDDVEGMVHVKKAIAVPHDRRADVPVTALMVPPVFVPETVRLDPLLLQLRGGGLQLALVIDEYAGTSGIVSLEDVIEEIVGEVTDEHDKVADPSRLLADGSWTVSGMWRPDEVADRIGAEIPEGPNYETVGGFVMAQVGRVPEVGDEVELDGWRLRVLSMDRRRVDRVRLTPVVPEAAEEEQS